MPARRRAVITGMGWVTPLGHDLETVWQKLLAGESGVAPTTVFEARTFPTTFSAEVKDFDLADFLGDDATRHAEASRNCRFALAAAQMAWSHSGLATGDPLDPARVGVYLGGGEGPIDFDNFAAAAVGGWNDEQNDLDTLKWASIALERLRASTELEQDPNMAAGHIACQFNAAGPNFNSLTACAASTQAIGEATRLIRRGDADVMISGGTHSMI
ncbi:MAG: beta-ketoacyl synthase N-terminal-like domain-containing protein, partial [Phycisphaerae bacterium]